ncbi:MAG: PKD domain-containing protein, partial [Halobacteriota archaeon]
MRKSDYPKVIRRGVAVMVILSLLLLLLGAFAPAAMAADWPNCDWGCTANDTDVTRVWLGNCTTQANLSSCTAGTPVEACIFADFHNTASSDRYQAFVLFDLYINYVYDSSIEKCVVDRIPSGESSYNVYTLNWTCGDRVELRNFVLTWTPKNCTCNDTPNCTGKCGHPPSKCYAANITVEAPLVANFTFDNVCFCTYTTFTDKTTGGKKPYTYDWDFDDGNSSNAQNPTHHYGKNGTYNVTLTVTDSNTTPNTDSQSYNVTVYALPSCNITALDAVCELSASNNASTNAGYANYSWALSAGTITAGQYTDAITWTAPGSTASPVNISVTVIDVNNCTNTCYKNVTVYALPSCAITALDAV